MRLPKNITPALIRKLNLACDRAFEDAQAKDDFEESACFDCISVGWCGMCWDAVKGKNDNAMIVGKIGNRGLADG